MYRCLSLVYLFLLDVYVRAQIAQRVAWRTLLITTSTSNKDSFVAKFSNTSVMLRRASSIFCKVNARSDLLSDWIIVHIHTSSSTMVSRF